MICNGRMFDLSICCLFMFVAAWSRRRVSLLDRESRNMLSRFGNIAASLISRFISSIQSFIVLRSFRALARLLTSS